MTEQDKIQEICRRSSIPPEEAEKLLEFHHGDLNKALLDLKKHNFLLPENKPAPKTKKSGHGVRDFLLRPYTLRVQLRLGEDTVLDFAVFFFALCILLAPHMALLAFLAAKLLGYRFRFQKSSAAFTAEHFTQRLHHFWLKVQDLFRLEEEQEEENENGNR